MDAVWSNGKLWLGLNDGCGANNLNLGVCIRLSQISTTGPSLLQDFDAATSSAYFYPALRVDGSGNLGLIAGYSNGQTYPSLTVTGQAYNAPVNTLAPPVTLKAGSAPDTTNPPRYGDYFGAGLDPSDPTILWVVGEYHNSVLGTCESFHRGSGNCWSTFIGSIKIGDFGLSASPSTITVAKGSSGNSTITVTSKSGFSGAVSLSASAPTGITTSLNPSSVSITPTASGTSVLTVNAGAPAGNYTVTVTGSGAGISRQTTVTVRISDFSISAPFGINCFAEGNGCSYTVTLTSINGFAGTVSLSITAKPAGTTGTVSPSSVTLTSGGTTGSRVTITPPASGNVTVQGTSGNSAHSVNTHITLVH
jgi:hypothetical protein